MRAGSPQPNWGRKYFKRSEEASLLCIQGASVQGSLACMLTATEDNAWLEITQSSEWPFNGDVHCPLANA